MLIVKHTLIAADKMKIEGNSPSVIPDIELPSSDVFTSSLLLIT